MLLLLNQSAIMTRVAFHEFVVSSPLYDLSAGNDEYDIGVSDGGETVCDDDGGAFVGGEELIEGFLDD